jgi:class 3 adenylate cyclase
VSASEVTDTATRAAFILLDKAERRQLTLLFCDMADSVGLSTRLDPEDLRDLLAAYQRVCVQSVGLYGGYVAQYAGDGVLAYFGYPVAYEDNAERAILAALELLNALARLTSAEFANLNVRVRIGIATGLVVVGGSSAGTQGGIDHSDIVGEAANLAARLQAIAEPNTVVVSDITRQLAANRFKYRDLGKHYLKGFDAPVSVFQVLRLRELSRLEARGAPITPFVGREEDISRLVDHWQCAVSHKGQVVILAGQAGIGKSRVVVEALNRLGVRRPPAPLVLQHSPYHSNEPLYPVVKHLLRLADIGVTDSSSVKFAKLARLFGDDPARRESLSLIAELLGLEGAYEAFALEATTKRHRTIDTLVRWIADRGNDGVAIVVFEDVQWIDPTSKVLLARLANWAKDASALIVVTVRADGLADAYSRLEDTGLVEPDGRIPAHVTIRELGELDTADSRRLAHAVIATHGRALESEQLNAVVAKSEGIPLYLEELAKAAVGGVQPGNRLESVDQSSPVPHTLNNALMAQLDQLGFAKEVAQHASVIGPEFSAALLARIMGQSLDEMMPMLVRLLNSHIVVRGSTSSDGYRFRHALIGDIAYRSLLRKNRRQIHLGVARELCNHSLEAGAASEDLIAQHYSRGEAHLEAIEYWRRGVGKAIARSANEEAIAMLQSALVELEKLRGTARPGLELDLVLTQAMALRSVRGYSAVEVEQKLKRAQTLSADSGDLGTRFSVIWGLFQSSIVKGDVVGARAFAADLLELAGNEPGLALADAHMANGMVSFIAGDFEAAMKFHESGAKLCQPETDQPRFRTHGQNTGLFCLSYLARTQCILGFLDRGRATIGRARAIAAMRARDLGHIHSYLNTAVHAARVHHHCGDLEAEGQVAIETVELARRSHYAYYEAIGMCHLGWVTGAKGNLDEGTATLIEGLALLDRTGATVSLPRFYALLAQLYIRGNRLEEASQALDKTIGARGHMMSDADLERVRGDIAVASNWEAGEAAYRSSLAIARHQGAKLYMCEAALGLARVLLATDRRKEARELLEDCLSHLEEGYDVDTIRQAQSMLYELSGS